MIKHLILTLLLFISGSMTAYAMKYPSELELLYQLSGKNFILSSIIPEDSIIRLSTRLESEASKAGDFENYFRIGQIKVNSYCLKGDIGVATNEAELMYEHAQKMNSTIGIALSLQAIGSTYMSLDQMKQAFDAFVEAENRLKLYESDPVLIRLYLQIIHVSYLLGEPAVMHIYLDKLSKLQHTSIVANEYYDYYALCYETLYQIEVKDKIKALALLDRLDLIKDTNPFYKRWYYWVKFKYNELEQDYKSALAFVDSNLVEIRKSGNLNEYRNVMIDKAVFLEKMNDITEACNMYTEVRKLTDSLDMQRYTRQIEHLHTTYLVDQLKSENESVYSSLYKWTIICCTIILLGGIAIFYMVWRKNKMLVVSRNKLQVVREETTRSIQSKSMFLSNMSHELRTPLNAIVGFSGILVNYGEIDAETKQQCGESIQQNADLLLKLIKDVMDMSELNINEIRYTCNTYNVVNICRMVVDTVDKVKQTSAAIQFSSSVDELSLYTDSGRLQQVLINLLINATKFTKQGNIILRLDVDTEKQEAVFTVEDTGCGIPLEKQPYIFGRFEKLHEGVQGAGLGLSICQLIVEHFGGKIWIDPTYTIGARFIFTHPLSLSNNQTL